MLQEWREWKESRIKADNYVCSSVQYVQYGCKENNIYKAAWRNWSWLFLVSLQKNWVLVLSSLILYSLWVAALCYSKFFCDRWFTVLSRNKLKAFSKNKGPINCSSVSYLVNNISHVNVKWSWNNICFNFIWSIHLIIIVWSWFVYLLNTGRPSLLPVIGHPGSSLSVWKLDPNTLSFPLKGLLPYEKVHEECQVKFLSGEVLIKITVHVYHMYDNLNKCSWSTGVPYEFLVRLMFLNSKFKQKSSQQIW